MPLSNSSTSRSIPAIRLARLSSDPEDAAALVGRRSRRILRPFCASTSPRGVGIAPKLAPSGNSALRTWFHCPKFILACW